MKVCPFANLAVMDSKVSLLLITANVGSLFEDVKHILPGWTQEVHQKIASLAPKFVALHFQEIGGKVPSFASERIDLITKNLLDSQVLADYSTVLGYFDQDYQNNEKFTALGALYLVHDSLKNIAMWNYSVCGFERIKKGRQIYTDKLDSLPTIEKLKYPQRFFPQMKWSRKGYLKTKWKIAGIVINLVNIHLFHDPSNLIAMEMSPSVYVENRKNAFEYVLKSFEADPSPCFIFGDFNFRLDTHKVIKMLSQHYSLRRTCKDGEDKPVQVLLVDKRNQEKVHLLVENSKFELEDQQQFVENNGKKLLKFDRETRYFKKWVYEFPITFPPSYPFCEESKVTNACYVGKRCPSWCDRVLLTHSAKEIIMDSDEAKYEINGLDTCMGDHKPISLYFHVAGNTTFTQDPKDVVSPSKVSLMLETSV